MAFGALEDVQVCTADGTAPNFTGSIVEGVTETTETTPTVLTYIDVVALVLSVPKPYRQRSVFLADVLTIELLSTLVDAFDRPLLTPLLTAPTLIGDGAPGTMGVIFGRPVFEVPLVTGTLWYGDTKQYGMLTGSRFSMRADSSILFHSDEVAFKIIGRTDGVILQVDAMRLMAGLATVA